MSTEKNSKLKIIGWYQPHEPVRFDGSITNPVTGELTYPPSRTKQEFLRQCDINNIIKEFSLTGQVNHISAKAAQGAYLDLPDDLDFHTSMNIVKQAETAFMTLPAAVRDRFGNEPEEFLRFCADPANADEMIKLGLRTPPPRAPQASPGAPAAPAAPSTPEPPAPPPKAP